MAAHSMALDGNQSQSQSQLPPPAADAAGSPAGGTASSSIDPPVVLRIPDPYRDSVRGAIRASRDPKALITKAIADFHKNKGEGYQITAMNGPKKVTSKIDGKEVVMARVQHYGSEGGVEKEKEDHILLLRYGPANKVDIQMIKFEDWDAKKVQYGIEEEP